MLQVEELTLGRGGEALLSGLSFGLGAGESCWIKGSNGAGKTTLLRTLAGLMSPLGGSIRWRSESVFPSNRRYQQSMFYLSHRSCIKGELTPLENLQLYCRLRDGLDAQDRCQQRLSDCGLAEVMHLPCRQLSQGQRKRVQLSMLLIQPAHLWLMDEPFASIDAEGVRWLAREMNAHLASGGLLVMTNHQPATGLPLPDCTIELSGEGEA